MGNSQQCSLVKRVDENLKLPVFVFLLSGALWLVLSTVLGLIMSIKLHAPGFMADSAWFTYGRVQAAFHAVSVYGWACNAAFAIGLWILARLNGSEIKHGGVLVPAGVFWNLGVAVGFIGILKGDLSTAFGMPFPGYVSMLLAGAYIMIGVWGIASFCQRKQTGLYVAQHYVIAGLLCFSWLHAVGFIMLFFAPARGVLQSIVEHWYGYGVLWLFLGSIAIGAAYYVIPKILGKALEGYSLAGYGFWLYVIAHALAGTHELVGGPVPGHVIGIGLAGVIITLASLLIIFLNVHRTIFSNMQVMAASPALSFIQFGMIAMLLAVVINFVSTMPNVAVITQFTYFTYAAQVHTVFAFFSMVAFGVIYYMLPQVFQVQWPSVKAGRMHFWLSSIGILAIVMSLYIAGWVQGLGLANPEVTFSSITKGSIMWISMSTLGYLVLLIANLFFSINILRFFTRSCCACLCADENKISNKVSEGVA